MSYKILIIGPSWVGDMVMAQSLFKLLREQHADLILDVIAPAWTFSLLNIMPEVSQAIAMPIQHGEFKWRTRYELGKKLRHQGYHQAIVLPNSFKSALIPWFARIPKRTGWLGEFRYFLLNDIRYLDKKRYPLMIEQYLALGLPSTEKSIPTNYAYPSFTINQKNVEQTLEKHQLGWKNQKVLAICAGGEYGPSKRWLPEYFAYVANKKIKEEWEIWLYGSHKDKPITDEIMQLTENKCLNLAGKIDLTETIDLLSLVSGVLTNDSGLMHVACALEKPVIAIYGSTSPAFTPPLSNQANILKLDLPCQPCFERTCPLKHHRCMRDLTPDYVLSAINGWVT